MHREDYESYAEYLKHQRAGRLDPKKLEWVQERRRERVDAFAAMFRSLGMSADSACLCIGARFGEEVEAGLGCFASCVGVDLVAHPPLVVEGDMHALEFGDGSFDLVYSNVIDHAYDLRRNFAEMERVLAPGGMVVVDTFFRRRVKKKRRRRGGSLGHYTAIICESAEEVIRACGLPLERQEAIADGTMVEFGLRERFLFRS